MYVRRLTPDDAASFMSLRRAALEGAPWAFGSSPEDDQGGSADFVREMLASDDQVVLVAETDDCVGMVGVYRDGHAKSRHKCHLWGMYVVPEARSQGVGRALLGHAIDYARSQPGVTHLMTSATERATEAMALYRSMGFVTWGIETASMRVGDDLLAEHHMVLALHESGAPAEVEPAYTRLVIRPETPGDYDAIRRVNLAAFENHPFSNQTEHLIVEALRSAGALELSLVAEVADEVVGHIAFSPAPIGDASAGGLLVGPVAVLPDRQGQGIGRALIEAGLGELRSRGALGCVLVGDPDFYVRFGFRSRPEVSYPNVPNENVMCLSFSGAVPAGEVVAHEAFSLTDR